MSDPRKRRVANSPTGSPLLWVGGKKRLLPKILPILGTPEHVAEVFTGSAAVTYGLLESGHLPKTITWMDAVRPLLATHRAIATRPAKLVGALTRLEASVGGLLTREKFEKIRQDFHDGSLSDGIFLSPDTLARFLVINRAGFNGLWRVNRDGRCNVPWGKWALPPEDWQGLREAVTRASRQLEPVRVSTEAWDARTSPTPVFAPRTVIYVDPPYPGTYSGYDTPWTLDDFDWLCTHIETWASREHRVLVSFPLAHLPILPKPTEIVPITVPDTVGGTGAPRGAREEILAVYEPTGG